MAGRRKKGLPEKRDDGTWVNDRGELVCGAKKTRRVCCPNKGDGPCVQCVCQSTHLKPNGFCKFHRGCVPAGPAHPSWRHGRNSKMYHSLPQHLRAAFIASTTDTRLISVETEIGLLDARVLDLIERLTTGESATTLKRMGVVIDAMDEEMGKDEPNMARLGGATAALRQLLKERSHDQGVWADILQTTEARRLMSDTERRLLEAEQAMVDVRELRTIMAIMVGSVRTHVLGLPGGKEAVQQFSQDVRRLVEGKPILGEAKPAEA